MTDSKKATDVMMDGYFEADGYVSQFGWWKAKEFLDTELSGSDMGLARHSFYLGWSKYLLECVLEGQVRLIETKPDLSKMH